MTTDMGLTLGGVFCFLAVFFLGDVFWEEALLGEALLLLRTASWSLRMPALMRSLLALVGTVVVVFFLWVQPFFPFFLRLTGGAEWSLGSLPGLKLITLHIILISGRRAALLNQAGVEKSTFDQLK